MSYWVYILASGPGGTLYVGMTNNLVRRVYEHREGFVKGFTRRYGVKRLVYFEAHDTALAALQRERPDVLISDIEMPGGDGYEMIRALRLRDADTEAPVPAIALTGTTRPEDRIRMLASGFQVHVPKPVDPEELVAAVAAMAAQCRTQRTTARRIRDQRSTEPPK